VVVRFDTAVEFASIVFRNRVRSRDLKTGKNNQVQVVGVDGQEIERDGGREGQSCGRTKQRDGRAAEGRRNREIEEERVTEWWGVERGRYVIYIPSPKDMGRSR
jgi:hypothetical protein